VSEQGVPIDEVTAKDFIMVRAALVKRLGGANEAIVWSRIEYRASSAKHAHQVGEQLWWAASYDAIADETGLTRDQVKRALKVLVDGGFLLAEQHHGSLRVMSYSPVIAHGAESPDGIPQGEIALSRGQDSPIQKAESPDAPSIETAKTVEISVAPVIALGLERVWAAWPSSRRSTRKVVVPKWAAAVKSVGMKDLERLVVVAEQFGARYATWAPSEIQFVPLLSTWLHQERWTTALPEEGRGKKSTTLNGARNQIDILRARKAGAAAGDQRAVRA
jgi:hypothetical protein